jgi:hypothetical protein
VTARYPAVRTTVLSNAPLGSPRDVMEVVTLRPRREGER